MRIGTLNDTKLVIHPTFWLIVLFVGFVGYNRGLDAAAVVAEILFVLTIFACVVLHELGHVMAARRYGIRTESITLYPIGGVARLEKMPTRPSRELVVALAGPLVNVVIAGLLGGVLLVIDSPFLARLAIVNAILVLFNLLPAFPMDGGRVLRALLAMRMSHARATGIAATVGRAMTVPFFAAGLLWNPFLMLIGIFVWIGATAEAKMVQMRDDLAHARVLQASMGNVFVLEPHDRLRHAVELTLDSPQKDFPVTKDGEIIGALTQGELLTAIETRGPSALVADAMRKSPPTIEGSERLEEAVALMQRTGVPFLPVSSMGEVVGILTMDNVQEFVKLRKAYGGKTPIRMQRSPLELEPAMPN